MLTHFNKFILLFISVITFSSTALAEDLGVGIVIGDPTGISFKYGMDTDNAIDAALAWSGKVDLHLHADYLWHHIGLFKFEGQRFDGFYGIGGRLRQLDDSKFRNDDDDDTRLGARGPGGIRWLASKIPLEVFVELAIIFDVIPETDASIDGGIGVRYFF